MSGLTGVFSRIYRRNLWNGVESRSGPGSGLTPTRTAADWLLRVVERYRIVSLLDVGCGDSFWLPYLPGYVGIDVAPEAVRRAKAFHPDRSYLVADATVRLPEGSWDAVLCRDVIQHLPFEDGLRLIANVRAAGVRYLIASTYTGTSTRNPRDLANVDIRAGECYSPVLTAPPFDLPRPLLRVRDGWDYSEPDVLRDDAKWLAIWRLA